MKDGILYMFGENGKVPVMAIIDGKRYLLAEAKENNEHD